MKAFVAALAVVVCPMAIAGDSWVCTSVNGEVYHSKEDIPGRFCKLMSEKEWREEFPDLLPPPAKGKPFKSNPAKAKALMAAGKVSIVRQMKDPSSVQFRSLSVTRDTFLCGELNAKNSYGGYVGFKKFITDGGPDLNSFDDGSLAFHRYWLSSCTQLSEDEVEAVMNSTAGRATQSRSK